MMLRLVDENLLCSPVFSGFFIRPGIPVFEFIRGVGGMLLKA
jgi:hypothetical protein